MPWSAHFNTELSIVEAAYDGNVTPSDLIHAARRIFSLMKEYDTYLLLADCSNLTGGHSVVDLIKTYEDTAVSAIISKFREAVIFPSGFSPKKVDVQFWETYCRNRGLKVTAFTERNAALEWLQSSAD